MARPIKLTRDERIILGTVIDGPQRQTFVRPVNTEHVLVKLQHRGLLDADHQVTDKGRRAFADARVPA